MPERQPQQRLSLQPAPTHGRNSISSSTPPFHVGVDFRRVKRESNVEFRRRPERRPLSALANWLAHAHPLGWYEIPPAHGKKIGGGPKGYRRLIITRAVW